jgi:hypothetical protein
VDDQPAGVFEHHVTVCGAKDHARGPRVGLLTGLLGLNLDQGGSSLPLGTYGGPSEASALVESNLLERTL